MDNLVKKIVYKKITKNLHDLNRSLDDIEPDTDLLKSGIIDSMEFIELLAEIAEQTQVSLESFLDDDEELKITINWFIKKFKKDIDI